MLSDSQLNIYYPKHLYLNIPSATVAAVKQQWPVGRTCQTYQLISDVGQPELPIYAPLAGKIVDFRQLNNESQQTDALLQIKVDSIQSQPDCNILSVVPTHWHQWPEWLRQSSLIGMGGSGYPSWKKIAAMTAPPQAIVINAVECEAEIEVDSQLVADQLSDLSHAGLMLKQLLPNSQLHFVTKDSWRQRVKSLVWPGKITYVSHDYPAGHERQIIDLLALTDQQHWRYPADVGIWVMNVHSLWSLFQWYQHQIPACWRLTHIHHPLHQQTLWLPVGTSAVELAADLNLDINTYSELAIGGNKLQRQSALPTTYSKLSDLAWRFNKKKLKPNATPCYRCGACYPVCPEKLNVPQLLHLAEQQSWQAALTAGLDRCLKCGACEASCPAQLPLTELLSHDQQQLRAWQQQQQWFQSCNSRSQHKQQQKKQQKLRQTSIPNLLAKILSKKTTHL